MEQMIATGLTRLSWNNLGAL